MRVIQMIVMLLIAAGGLAAQAVGAEEPGKAKELTAQQEEKLKERDALWEQTQRLKAEGKLVEAIAAGEKVLVIERDVIGDDHADVADTYEWLSGLHEAREAFAAASKAREEVLRIRAKQYGESHWQVVDARLALAHVALLRQLTPQQREELRKANESNTEVVQLYHEGKYPEAIRVAESVLAVRERLLGLDHPFTATSLNNLAALYESMADCVKAETLCNRALKIREDALGPDHPDTATSLNLLAELYYGMGNYAKAEPFCTRALKIREKALGPDHPSTATSLNNQASLYDSIGEYAKAEPLYNRALKIREDVLGPDHPGWRRRTAST